MNGRKAVLKASVCWKSLAVLQTEYKIWQVNGQRGCIPCRLKKLKIDISLEHECKLKSSHKTMHIIEGRTWSVILSRFKCSSPVAVVEILGIFS